MGRYYLSTNDEIVRIFASQIKTFNYFHGRDGFENHYKYVSALNFPKNMIADLEERKDSHIRFHGSKNKGDMVLSDIMREITWEEGSTTFSPAMYEAIINMIKYWDKTKEYKFFLDPGEYILFDEEKKYLTDLFKKEFPHSNSPH